MSYRNGFLIGLAGLFGATSADAAIISSATGRRAIRTGGTYQIRTTTRGQRQIIITIDPSITTAFRVDVSYPSNLVAPDGFAGFGVGLPSTAIEYIPPYGNPKPLIPATLTAPGKGGDGVISNIEGEIVGPVTGFQAPGTMPDLAGAPIANPAGGSNLFNLIFDDRAPEQDKVFKILGFDARGIDPANAGQVSDNFIDAVIDDPTDPLNGQVFHFSGEDIEQGYIIVPGEKNGGVGQVPLPSAIWGGLVVGAVVVGWHAKRRKMSAECA